MRWTRIATSSGGRVSVPTVAKTQWAFRPSGYPGRMTRTSGQGELAMPPNEECPHCQQKVEDWHVEWYPTEGPLLYKGVAAMDCPLCRQPVRFQYGKIGLAAPRVPQVRRPAERAT